MKKIAVWDTYVTKKDGTEMHFDIIVPETQKDANIIFNYGKEYITSKGQNDQPLTAQECSFCHFETLKPKWEESINRQGYFILEIDNCD